MSPFEDHETEEHAPYPQGPPHQGILKTVLRWWWIPALMAVAGLGGAYAYLSQADDLYVSSSLLRVWTPTTRVFKEDKAVVSASSLETECGVITSGAVLGAAVDSPALAASMGTFADPEAKGVSGDPVPLERAARILLLKEIVEANVVKGMDIIRITCESPLANDAADIANAVSKAYITYQNSQERTEAGKVLNVLTEEERERRGELDKAVAAMTKFRLANSRYTFGPGGGSVAASELSTLTGALTQTRLSYYEAEAVFEAAQQAAYGKVQFTTKEFLYPQVPLTAAGGDALSAAAETEAGPPDIGAFTFPEIIYSKAVRRFAEIRAARGAVMPMTVGEELLEGELAAAKRREARLLDRGVPESNPQLVGVREEIKDLADRRESSNDQFARKYLVLIGEQLRSADIRRAKIAELLVEAQRSVRNYNELAAKYELLESAYRESKNIVDFLASRIKEIRVTENVGVLNIDSLESAEAAIKPSKPNRPRIYVMGVVAGLLVGVGLALLRDFLDHRIRSAEEVAAVLGVPVMGAVPDMGGKKEDLSSRGQYVLQSPTSGVAEAVRSIRTSLVFSGNGSPAKTILMTSPSRGDGKSTLTANLAISMAQAGRRTLLIDADFRKPVQQRIFNLDGAEGLVDVMAGRTILDAVLCATAIEDLHVLPCGSVPANPSELLNSEMFSSIIEQLSEMFDCILIDSPPLGPVTDPMILGALCDRTLLVLRAEETTRRNAERARDILQSVGARLMGAVINAVPRRRGGIYSFDGYEGYRAYGQEPTAPGGADSDRT